MVRVACKPRHFPGRAPVGPPPPPGDWQPLLDRARAAGSQEELQKIFEAWTAQAVPELCEVFHLKLKPRANRLFEPIADCIAVICAISRAIRPAVASAARKHGRCRP